MSDHDRDDDLLLAELAEALAAGPPTASPLFTGVSAAAPAAELALEKALYTWRDIDAELATITFDSLAGAAGVLVRTETAVLRTMTFQSPSLTLELGLTPTGLVGQVVPPGPGTARLHTASGVSGPLLIDELGCFVVEARPAEQFRLVCETADGVNVITDWISP